MKQDSRDVEIKKRIKTLRKLEKNLKGFDKTQFTFTNDYTKVILFDSVNKMIGIIDSNKNFAKNYKINQIASVERLDSIKIKVTVEDVDSPIHIFDFIGNDVEINSSHYKKAVNKAVYWNDLLEKPMVFIKKNSKFNRNSVNFTNKRKDRQKIGGLSGCLILILLLLVVVILIASCVDIGGTNYQPGDFDFDGDSGDFDDAVKFLEWKMNQDK